MMQTASHHWYNWSSPWAGPYVCIELRACAEVVAYGHLKSRACAEEVAYTGICNGCIHAQEKHIRAFDGNDRLLAKITAPPVENLHVYLSVFIYILVRKFVWGNNLFFLFNKRTSTNSTREFCNSFLFDKNGQGVASLCVTYLYC